MEIVFTFENTHGAISGEKSLLDAGIAVKVMPLPSALGAGCGLCLRVDEESLAKSVETLSQAKIYPEAVYSKSGTNGDVRYIPVRNHQEI